MVDTNELMGNFLSIETCREGDIVEIKDEGKLGELNGHKLLNIEVSLNGKDLIYSPGIKVLKAFRTEWGTESKNWIGRKFQIKFVEIEFSGKEMKVIRPHFLKEEKK